MAIEFGLPLPVIPLACEKHAVALQFIEEMTKNAGVMQERVLREILSRNAEHQDGVSRVWFGESFSGYVRGYSVGYYKREREREKRTR
ncbi:hypothetical protein RHGRI_011083 [Rhododendron griersonianum]|uniref:Uncharacterized protein n=1 Tax=Rhododendron griersonianum TaxID=479676 RepID=A0AAV6KKP2_9ERIC|nr:hypothetical protein RHGRI_011083 [Rhododendron griersonianum]